MLTRLQHFSVGVLVTVAFPMLPLGVEFKYSDHIASGSLYIASVMYVAAISMAYENVLIFFAGIVASIWLAVDYGALLSGGGTGAPATLSVAVVAMLAFGVAQVIKCYDLHVIQGQNFVHFPLIKRD